MKKLIALLFVVAMLSVVLVMPAAAAKDAPVIDISTSTGTVGETAQLTVSIDNNPGLVSYTLQLDYDKSSLELTKIEKVNADFASESTGKINFYNPSKLKGDVVLCKLTFKVLKDGDHSVSAKVLSAYDLNEKEINDTFEVNEGGIDDTCAHKWVRGKVTRKATCTQTGRRVDTCSKCGEKRTVVLAKLAHKTEVRNAVAATCGTNGYTGDTYCTVCEKLIKAGEVIPATGEHTIEVRNAKDPTCTVAGHTGDEYCSVCNALVKEGEEIPALGHKWGSEYKFDENHHWQVCTVCGEHSAKEAHDGNPCSVCGYEKAGLPVIVIILIIILILAIIGGVVAYIIIKKKKK